MAVSYGSPLYVSGQGGPALLVKTRVTLDAAAATQTAAVPHAGPSGAEPVYVILVPITNCTAGGGVVHTSVAYDTTNDEVDIVFESGDATINVAGAVFDVFVAFNDVV